MGQLPPLPPTLDPRILKQLELNGDRVWVGVRTGPESPDHFALFSTVLDALVRVKDGIGHAWRIP
jgi:hypothetical protein